jgi:hypothetical protein
MSELIIATIVLQSLTLLATSAAPIVSGIGFILSHVRKSSCCGGTIEVDPDLKKKDSEKLIAQNSKT